MDGINAHLHGYLLTYQPQLSSLVLSYSGVQLLSATASIFYDRPYLNFPVQLTLTTLQLQPGTAHHGRVSRVGADYITLLVYGVFHCVVQRGDIPAWYEFGLLEREGRRTEMLADTRQGAMQGWQPKNKSSLASSAAAAAGGDAADEQASKKQAAKQKKAQEKEERRQAYLRTQQPSTTTTATADSSDSNAAAASDDTAIDYAIRLGSLVRFVILTSVNHDSFISMSGSLTAEGATVVPGDVVVPAELRAKEEAEEEERRRTEEAEATSVEKLFAGEEDAMVEADDRAADATSEAEAHVSKKEMKERKQAEKANRKAAKQLRKQLRGQSGGPQHPSSSSTATQRGGAE